ncbi:type II secretion system F family protein [Kineosporia sp. NBRC 101731]|uniref:type II secretion system F family protein n=1 Tax=Kineosporia sp. NBRC 101731 TaxID=3032199 RepID=UPI0024A24BFD|nr:type II secretion system F family protein [Kineosporia sp. NBRC 101731]GLY32850.1 type II secretion system protein [Kineosporia sp. NBRC 101731]
MTLLMLPGTGLVILLAGLAGVFAVLLLTGEQRRDARIRRALLEKFRAVPVPLRRTELEVPFTERVVAPLVRRFAGAGRKLTTDSRIERIRVRLDLAGNPPGWDVDRVLGLKALGLVTGALLGLVIPPLFGAGPRGMLLTFSGLSALSWFAPTLWIYQVGYDRTELVRRELPDAIDLLTISVEAGLAFDAALAQVARSSDGPLAKELFRVLQEMQLGTGRLAALRALADRTDVEELRIFVAAMVQADTFGIPVAGVLRVQSKEMRVKRSQRAEEKAQQVPVKILFPLIFCILPALFIVVMGPAGIKIFEQFRGM